MVTKKISDRVASEAIWEREVRLCRRDPAYFMQKYWTISTKQGSAHGRFRLSLFDLYPFQHDFLETLATADTMAILKGRQIGFTKCVSSYLGWVALFFPNSQCYYATIRGEDAAEVVRDVRDIGVKRVPKWMRRRGVPKIINDADGTIRFSNGSAIHIASAGSGNPVRGRSASVVVLDEFAFYKQQAKVLASALPAVEGGGKLIIASTSDGLDNDFGQLWTAASEGESGGYVAKFYGWRSVPSRDQRWYQKQLLNAKTDLQRQLLAREHPDSPEDAFMNVGRTVFDAELIAQQNAEINAAFPRQGVLTESPNPSFQHDETGFLSVWEDPDPAGVYVIGADAAAGLEHGDSSCAIVLNALEGNVVAVWHGNVDANMFGAEIDKLGRWYNRCLVGVESNGPGQTVLSRLMDCGYPNIYRSERKAAVDASPLPTLGWYNTAQSKYAIVEEISTGLRTGWLRITCPLIAYELRTFVRRGKANTMGGSPHDDRVIALGIALMMVRFVGDRDAFHNAELVEYTKEWWDEVERAYAAGQQSRVAGQQQHVGSLRLVPARR